MPYKEEGAARLYLFWSPDILRNPKTPCMSRRAATRVEKYPHVTLVAVLVFSMYINTFFPTHHLTSPFTSIFRTLTLSPIVFILFKLFLFLGSALSDVKESNVGGNVGAFLWNKSFDFFCIGTLVVQLPLVRFRNRETVCRT
ncbi:hypothetical protein LX32DRAFT_635886 [Colletotrichum zoysiae]|uniref:Uncharacterized protein n=1 Tax=Colletotrichum zoysiae TaxID=1216348 RepID=A0AAD9HP94_9PEZI|nr:hypothetical protein LX32DRAFT_635886 [Colletotrichum zoysiae]